MERLRLRLGLISLIASLALNLTLSLAVILVIALKLALALVPSGLGRREALLRRDEPRYNLMEPWGGGGLGGG